MASQYTKILGPASYEGTIDGISVAWHKNAKARLPNDADRAGVPHEKMKALTEHFALVVAKSLNNSTVEIMGALHNFTVDTGSGKTSKDGWHITMNAKGPTRGGNHNVHVYLAGLGDDEDEAKLDNLYLDGQAVFTKTPKTGKLINPSLSTPNYCENGKWSLSTSN